MVGDQLSSIVSRLSVYFVRVSVRFVRSFSFGLVV